MKKQFLWVSTLGLMLAPAAFAAETASVTPTIAPEIAAQANATPTTAGSTQAAKAEAPSLDSQLSELKIPENKAPALIADEKLYSVQNRYSNLRHRSEITVGGAHNFTGNTFLNSSQIDAAYHFHLTNRWDLQLSGSYGFNKLTDAANRLYQSDRILPDAAYVKRRIDFLLGYNFFYGKLRFTMEKVAYFDAYLAVGPGRVTTQFGTSTAAVGDAGLAFWLGQRWSARVGVKNSFFKEQRVLTSSNVYHMLGHVDVGLLFGGGA